MPENKNQGIDKKANNNTSKKHSFFGGEINEKTKDLLDFRYNTQEEIDKLNEEMTTTDDLDNIMNKESISNDTDIQENNAENKNEEDLNKGDEKEVESDLEKDLESFNEYLDNDGEHNNYDDFHEKKSEEPIEGAVVENPEESDVENPQEPEDKIEEVKVEDEKYKEESGSGNSSKFFDPFELNLDGDTYEEKTEGNDDIFDPFELNEEENEGETNNANNSEQSEDNLQDNKEEENDGENYDDWSVDDDEDSTDKESDEYEDWKIEDDNEEDEEKQQENQEEINDIIKNEDNIDNDKENSKGQPEQQIEEEIKATEDENNQDDEDWRVDDDDEEEYDNTNNIEDKENTDNKEKESEKENIEETNETEERGIINTNKEEEEKEEDDENNIIIDTPISINPNQKDEKEEILRTRKIKKNSATGEIITNEEIQLEQGQDNPNSEDDEEYQPIAEELFEYEPEFFADDELSQQFMHLVQNVREIFKLERKDEEQNPYFKILGGKTDDSILEYLFYLIEEKGEPIDLYIKKVETNQKSGEENEHLVQFSYNSDQELNVFVDEVILYERINKTDSDTPEYNDTKTILEKFIFLTDNHYDKLKDEINKQREERQKKKQLQQIFKGF